MRSAHHPFTSKRQALGRRQSANGAACCRPGPICGHLGSRPKPDRPELLAMPKAAKKANARGTNPLDAVSHPADVTDRMHALLMDRADALMGCTEGSPEEAELVALTAAIAAYERQRWPEGKIPGGKGSSSK